MNQEAQRPLFLGLSFPCSLPAPRLSSLLLVSIFQLGLLPPRSHAALGRAHQHALITIQLIKTSDSHEVRRGIFLYFFSRRGAAA